MKILCYKCGHSWNYKGVLGEKIYITCPGCMLKVRVDRSVIENSFQQRLNTSSQRGITTTTSFERVYFPNGFDCLVHKDIAAQFKELTLEDLQDEEEDKTPMPGVVVYFEQEDISNLCEDHKLPASYDSFDKKWLCNKCRDVNIPNIKFKSLGEYATITPIKQDQVIETIPRDPIKLLEHQRNFF